MNVYAVAGKLGFHFAGPVHLPDLLRKLQFAQIETPLKDSVQIRCYGIGAELKKEPWHFYKGIPWKAAVRYDVKGNISEVFFHAFWFRNFLFLRIVLLPLLWRLALKKVGFYLLGTVYRNGDDTHILFAAPGAGKTHFMLKQILAEECHFVADGSLLYLPEHGFMPVINEIELRWKTVAGLPWSKALSFKQKCYLQMCNFISILTRRFISFNLTMLPEELGIQPREDKLESAHKILFVQRTGELLELDDEGIQARVLDYLKKYHGHYYNIFDQSPPLAETQKNIRTFCERYVSGAGR